MTRNTIVQSLGHSFIGFELTFLVSTSHLKPNLTVFRILCLAVAHLQRAKQRDWRQGILDRLVLLHIPIFWWASLTLPAIIRIKLTADFISQARLLDFLMPLALLKHRCKNKGVWVNLSRLKGPFLLLDLRLAEHGFVGNVLFDECWFFFKQLLLTVINLHFGSLGKISFLIVRFF